MLRWSLTASNAKDTKQCAWVETNYSVEKSPVGIGKDGAGTISS